jgi:hypothetical protein
MQLRFPTLVLLALLAGCSKPGEYWLPGLTLPPGATILSKTEEEVQGADAGYALHPEDKALLVEFGHDGGWSAVSAHFDSFLRGKGFSDAVGAQADPGSPLKYMRAYEKKGAKYKVSVYPSGNLKQAADGSPDSDKFTLRVVRLK